MRNEPTKPDPHTEAASKIFEVSQDEVDEEQRRVGKVVNYGQLYGQKTFREDIPLQDDEED